MWPGVGVGVGGGVRHSLFSAVDPGGQTQDPEAVVIPPYGGLHDAPAGVGVGVAATGMHSLSCLVNPAGQAHPPLP
jgi:hypothetical protein